MKTNHKDKPTEPREVLVKVEGLGKKFCKDLKTSLWYGLKDLVTGMRGNRGERQLRPKEFWAVKDVSFELRRGECLGLIGHNGAGKSTLLKILNGLINPDAGKVTIKGRVGALIELGAGFNPILTGRENIYNNGAVLGFSRQEITQKLNDIIAFAELEEFIDMPVQNYSSGMKVRLGFAVAAQMEPDVLIIDEVLAVGDMGFVLKCFKTIDRILPNTAVVFVSHNMPMVSRICSQIILMDKGKAIFQSGDVSKAIDLYYARFANNDKNIIFDDGSIVLKKIVIKSQKFNDGLPLIDWGDVLKFDFEFNLIDKNLNPFFSIVIFDKEQRPVAVFEESEGVENLQDVLKVEVCHENVQLSKGIYTINLVVKNFNTNEPVLRINGLGQFQITHPKEVWQPFLLKAKYTFNH